MVHSTGCRAQVIVEDIAAAQALGADGVVCGCLERGGNVDVQATEEIYRQCKTLVNFNLLVMRTLKCHICYYVSWGTRYAELAPVC